jgi:hypothetical protein
MAIETVLNHKVQTGAVDIWAAGVIFLSFLCKRMPVFNLNRFSLIKDEIMREIIPFIIAFGSEPIRNILKKFSNFKFKFKMLQVIFQISLRKQRMIKGY